MQFNFEQYKKINCIVKILHGPTHGWLHVYLFSRTLLCFTFTSFIKGNPVLKSLCSHSSTKMVVTKQISKRLVLNWIKKKQTEEYFTFIQKTLITNIGNCKCQPQHNSKLKIDKFCLNQWEKIIKNWLQSSYTEIWPV